MPGRLIELIEAAYTLDGSRLEEKCRQYISDISTLVEECERVPEEIRVNGAKAYRHMDALLKVALAFEDLGHPELIDRLRGSHPIEDAIRRYSSALQLSNDGDYRESIEIGKSLLEELASSVGTFIDRYYPRINCLFRDQLFQSEHV